MDAMREGAAGAASSFGALLRQWRGMRRLSQLQLALDTDVSQRHVSFLESGRARPSRRMVLQLAETLDVPVRERNALLQAAGYSALYRHSDLTATEMAPVSAALKLLLAHHEPFPAMVVDRDWNLLDANPALGRLLAVMGDVEQTWARVCGEGPRNVMRLTFHGEGLRPLIVNWDEAAPMLLRRLQREVAATGSEAGQSLLADLYADPGIARQWQAPDLERPLEPVVPLELMLGDLRLRLFTMISTFGTPQDVTTDEIRVESLFPVDAPTRDLLRALSDDDVPVS